MSHRPRFSVIVPAYNKAETLERAVKSVHAQDFEDWELCLVVDRSDDHTEDVARRLADKNTVLLFRNSPGPGGYAARNVGIAHASGTYLAFLDADDEWLPSHLAAVNRLLGKNPNHGVVATNYVRVMEDSTVQENAYGRRYRRNGDAIVSLDEYLHRACHGFDLFRTSTLVISRTDLPNEALFPEHRCKRAGDSDAFLRLLAKSGSVLWLSTITGRYHRDAPSMVTKTIAPQIIHCTRTTIRHMLRTIDSRRTRRHLKRFHNMKVKGPLRRRARGGGLHISDFGRLYTGHDLTWILQELVTASAVRARNVVYRLK